MLVTLPKSSGGSKGKSSGSKGKVKVDSDTTSYSTATGWSGLSSSGAGYSYGGGYYPYAGGYYDYGYSYQATILRMIGGFGPAPAERARRVSDVFQTGTGFCVRQEGERGGS
eukprot:TRINITY_DN10473_c1_g1_i1.p3 TRINITY_DN10473_c1_g1~~TRINITY_DN10473_c1_g1_i1.p3  ORF type:complete len:112 (+),score=11.60 TRINITY_DN10473_c1_g1_i1:24-359(+)